MKEFDLVAPFTPAGDQPKAIEQLATGLDAGLKAQTLLGVTASGKTFSMAHVISRVQRPTLVMAHNKTLAAQLASEFRQFFPGNAVEYFVSYYDYYQPEAYIPNTDTYIEKEAQINAEIDRLRHAATQSLLTRRDVVVVASVSCIYGIGKPESYDRYTFNLKLGDSPGKEPILRRLTELQFARNDLQLTRGTFRAKGDVIEIMPMSQEIVYRIELLGDKIDAISAHDPVTMGQSDQLSDLVVFPAKHFMLDAPDRSRAFDAIETELAQQLRRFKKQGKLLEAERLERRTQYDLEMLREVGYCSGIENYSRHLDGRAPGVPPATLLNYFPSDFLCFIDESHVTVPQITGMYAGDFARKNALIEYGFRLPSASDNRPLMFEEFERAIGQVIFVSATPGNYELTHSNQVVEQIIRPTGLVDPQLLIHPTHNQINHLMGQVTERIAKGERTLVTTLTKKMAEDLTEYLVGQGVKVRYLHSDIDTLDRIGIIRDLRQGVFDVLVGVNLLREGLDLPEVSLVAVLDADKEGFLRSQQALIQTIGRAARNIDGKVVLYADVITRSLQAAIAETDRRRQLQVAYNATHGITPKTIERAITSLVDSTIAEPSSSNLDIVEREMAKGQLENLIKQKNREMSAAAHDLQFELAALLRDELIVLKKLQRQRLSSILG